MIKCIYQPKSVLSGLAALVMATTAGLAADLPETRFRPAIHDWSGPYIGATAGAGFLDTFYVPSGSPDPELAGDGYLVGGLAGYNMQFDNFVVGVEGDISFGEIEATNSLDQVDFEIPHVATFRLRAGYAHDRTLLYATGGLAIARGDMTLPAFSESEKMTHYGYVIGGGIEHALMDTLSIRMEYLYGNFEKKTYDFAAGNVRMGLDDLHIVRAGVVWNFMPGGF